MKKPLHRSWMILVALLLAVAAAALLAASTPSARSWLLDRMGDEQRNQAIAITSRLTARQVETADMVPIRHVGVNPLGVNTFLEQEVEISKRRQTMQMIRDAGIGWIRQQFPWEDIEIPSKGRYWDEKFGHSTWDKYDNIVDLANEYGLQPIVRLDLPPKWAHPNNPWPHTPPESFEDYGDFVHAVVSRYRGRVKYYQLWNEPNLAIEWGSKPVDAREYVRLLKVGYARAKQADPDAVILSAALAPTIEESWQALSDLVYLRQMYDAGARDYFDIMSVMAYGLRFGPDDRRLDLRDVNFSRPMLIREIMVRNGDASKAIWASEMGWNAQPESVVAAPTFGRVSEDLQARYTVRGFQRASEEWPWMGVMNVWFFRRPTDREMDQPFYYFRMVDPDWTPRPVYDAVKALGATPRAVGRGYSQEDHYVLEYRGEWRTLDEPRAGLGKMRATSAAGASITGSFSGTELTLVLPKGPTLGATHLAIDGSAQGANLLPRDDGRALLDLSAAEPSWQQQVPVARGLPDGVHRLEIETTGSFALDGLLVDARDSSPLLRPAAALMLALAVLGFAVLAALRRGGLLPRR